MGREDSLIEAHKWICGGCGGLRSSVEKSLWQRDAGLTLRRLWADGGGEEGVGEQDEKGVVEVEVEGKVEIEVVEV